MKILAHEKFSKKYWLNLKIYLLLRSQIQWEPLVPANRQYSMRPISNYCVITFVISLFLSVTALGQFGTTATAVWLSDCNQSNYFNTTGSGGGLIAPAANVFHNANLGAHTRNSGTLVFRGGEVRTSKNPLLSNVCAAKLYYRVYEQSSAPGAFTSMDLALESNCNTGTGTFPSGGTCLDGDQKWNRVIPNGTTVPYAPVNLTTLAAGNYILEVYYEVTGSTVTTTLCNETLVVNNGGANYKANFSVQLPALASSNPTTCDGTEGTITISGLVPGATYSVTYKDDGVQRPSAPFVANGAGQVIITGLDAGSYYDIAITINGCTTEFNTELTLSNYVKTPIFTPIAAFCAGSTAPTLPTTSNNGVTGTWAPATINNTVSGSYTFTPTSGQCGKIITINVTVNPNILPTFTFGTALTICSGASAPALPGTSLNAISGTWNPATISNTTSGSYVFTPAAGECATTTSLNVTVQPTVTPTFAFGSTLTICSGGGVPALPGTSSNGVTGTWSPATVNNTASGVYTFTPSAGQCSPNFTYTVTVNPNATPTFAFGTTLQICAGQSVPALPATSDNGVTGSWSPATVSNTASGTYTFTPSAGQCALSATFTVTVDQNVTPTFSFGTALTICSGASVPSLPGTSSNGITGSWNPATVSNTASGTYTFTPSAGQCATTATFAVTVNPNITPTFSFGTALTICSGGGVPALPNTSANGITGSWSPATVSNTSSGTYTFTPTAGECATSATYTVTVGSNTTPTFSFGASATICSGASVPTLPGTSSNGINGTWSPATVSNTASATYTFTPSAGQCALSASFNVTIAPNVTPTFSFGTTATICEGGSVPTLPATSSNGVSGTWSPANVDNTASGTYTFTPSAGQCALNATLTVTVNPNVTPTFSFGTTLSICSGGGVPSLSSTSSNGITGTWSPATVSNTASDTYTFTPSAGQCALSATYTVTVTANTTPVFGFGSSLTICSGEPVPSLPGTSSNGVTGTWSPATVSNTASGTYTFTPSAGQCALSVTYTVTVNPIITPDFNFGTSMTICVGSPVPTLVTTSNNGVTGTWNPSTVDDQNSGTYTFTPSAGQACTVGTTFTVTVNQYVTTTFSFGTSLSICAGAAVPALPGTSSNGITGTWSPAVIDNNASGTYTFTPAPGQCGSTVNFTVDVTPNTMPTFSFGTSLSICAGEAVPSLPTTSSNGISGSWNPAVVDNQTSGVYTFTADPVSGQCFNQATFNVTVNPIVTPTFAFGTSKTICSGSAAPVLPATSLNGINGSWNPAVVSNINSATYTFTPTSGQCAAPTVSFDVIINPIPTVSPRLDTTVNDGAIVPAFNMTGTPPTVTFTWTNSNPSIGLGASGSGPVPSFTAINQGVAGVSATITVTPTMNGCTGNPVSYVINVMPLDKDFFVPNVFSPNGDGKNDVFVVYGNYIQKLQMRVFNQWGEQVIMISNPKQGWDGRFKGKAQPVGVYVYVLEAEMTDGRKVTAKGNVTLLR